MEVTCARGLLLICGLTKCAFFPSWSITLGFNSCVAEHRFHLSSPGTKSQLKSGLANRHMGRLLIFYATDGCPVSLKTSDTSKNLIAVIVKIPNIGIIHINGILRRSPQKTVKTDIIVIIIATITISRATRQRRKTIIVRTTAGNR